MDGMLGSGTSNFLQKGTVYLTVGYFVLTMTLAVIQARTSEARSLQGKNLEVTPAATAPADEEPAPEEAGNPELQPEPTPTPIPAGNEPDPIDEAGVEDPVGSTTPAVVDDADETAAETAADGESDADVAPAE